MSSSNQGPSKATRSRYSSPSAGSQNRSAVMREQRNFMRSWLEPPVQNKPSFQDAGLMRSGVVENMAPLGTLPKSVTLKKTSSGKTIRSSPTPADSAEDNALEATPSVKKTTFKIMPYSQQVPLSTVEAPSTSPSRSSSVPALDMEVEESRSQSPLSRSNHIPPVMDDGADEDYVPKKTKKTRRSSTQQAGKSTSEDAQTTTNGTSESMTTRRQSMRRKTRRQSSPSPPQPAVFRAPSSTRDREPENKEMADKIVELAVEEALDFNRYPTAFAIRLLYDDYQNDPHFVAMIEDICHQRADIETLQEFTRLVKEKKKDGARNGNAYDYFVPPSDGSRVSPSKAKPAPYADLLTMDIGSIKDQDGDEASGEPPNKKAKLDSAEPLMTNGSSGGRSGATAPLQDTPKKSRAASAKGTPGSRKSPKKKARADSVSSMSSLSSVDSDELDFSTFAQEHDVAAAGDGEEGEEDGVDEDPSTAAAGVAPTPAGARQPIRPSHKKPASKKKDATAPKPAPSSNTSQHPLSSSSANSSMPATLIAEAASHQKPGTLKFPSRFGNAGDLRPYDKRKLATKATNTIALQVATEQSFTREPLAADVIDLPQRTVATPVSRAQSAAENSRAVRTPAPSSRATRAAKRSHDETDDQPSSPTSLSNRPDLEPPSSRPSRAATPTNPRSGKRARGGLRVKTSPMKKKGTAAGVPRSGGDRPSPLGFGPPNDKDDNDDSCYACGGNGELVCCDGCSYAFHFACIDPPLDPATAGDEWYCNECTYRAYPPIGEKKGVFGLLIGAVDRKNPRAFRLPERIREYFEGVKTGPEGEYEDIAPTGPKTKPGRKGYTEEPFDFFRVKNNDGTAALCHMCHKGAFENRVLLPCSECPLNWHLDCLDPPLACPPLPRTFRCPCHADDTPRGLMAKLAPAHRPRKIKGAPIIDQAYGRGLKNNGWIEIEEDSEDDSEAQLQSFGRVYRVPERGIKLDFISRVKRNRRQASTHPVDTEDPTRTVVPKFRSLEEEQAALNLAQLSQGGDDSVSHLIRAMITHASPAAVSIIAAGDAERIASGELGDTDVAALQSMLAQADAVRASITQLLAKRGHPVQSADSPAGANPLVAHEEDKRDVCKRRRSNDSAMQLD